MALQGALWLPESDWKAPRLSDLPSWTGASRVSIDIETCDPDLDDLGPGVRRGAFIAGVAFALEDGPGFYLPIAHEGGGNVDREQALAYLRDQAKNYRGTIVLVNGQYDLDFLAEVGVNFPVVAWVRDCQVAEPIIDELQMEYNLDAMAKRYKLVGKDKRLLEEACEAYGLKGRAAKHIWKLPAKFVAPYATQDVFLPLQLLRRQERIIEEQGLWDIYNLESQLLPVLLRMRRRGVRFSPERLEKVEQWSKDQEKLALEIGRAHV